MAAHAESNRGEQSIDFFISYSPSDQRWATWLAWELEAAGYSTMLQAWDFVAGTNFIDFMDRGVRQAAMVVAVLSDRYLTSNYCKMEWQAALRSAPDNAGGKLLTIRVEDCALDGLLATITYVDLVAVEDEERARGLVLERIRQSLAGRAKPLRGPGFPTGDARPPDPPPVTRLQTPRRIQARRAPADPPPFPPATAPRAGRRTGLSILHLDGPRFGSGSTGPSEPAAPAQRQERIMSGLTRLTDDGAPPPDLVVVAGDLTESGSPREFEEARLFLTGLRVLLGLEQHRLLVVPGCRDVNVAASLAYFANCEADQVEPRPPYWPKWRHYGLLFDSLYNGLPDPIFDSEQPWTLFALPDLQVVVAGLNSTIAQSHRAEDRYGSIGEAQAAWFAQSLQEYHQAEWLRLGLMAHAPDGDSLHDGETFQRFVAPALNLLLCGVAPSRQPTAVPVTTYPHGEAQLLGLSATGLRRWVLGRDATYVVGEDERHEWDRTSATLAGAGAMGQVPSQRTLAPTLDSASGPSDVDAPTLEPASDPTRQLLGRLAEVCEARHERVRVRYVATPSPHLFVTYHEDGITRQQRVAAYVGTPAPEHVDEFVRQVHAGNPDIPSEFVYDGQRIARAVYEEAYRRGVRVVSLAEFQGLLDLRDYIAAQTNRLQSDPVYPPGLYVNQRFVHLVGPDATVRDDLVAELLDTLAEPDGRFILLLGDFGRGKTFALRELARRLPTVAPDLIPIFVQLKALDKAHSVDGLVAAHLANHGEGLIDLKAFRYMLRQGRIVLLFDGFDELVARVSYDRAADHLETLLRAAEGQAKIVVTSRTQHFKTTSQVLTALGERVGMLPHRRAISVEDFTEDQVYTYLLHRYGGDSGRARRRLELLGSVQDLLGLSRNPRMLGFIANLSDERLQAVAQAGHAISAADLYREILDSWLGFEVARGQGVPGMPPHLDRQQLTEAVTRLAVRLWETNETYIRRAEIIDVAATLTDIARARLSRDQAVQAIGAGSLLIRTDAGLFGFIHTSVMEWLVATVIAEQLDNDETPALLYQRSLSQLLVEFICDLADTGKCTAWATDVLARPGAGEMAHSNALRLTARLRLPVHADLRNAVLRGEDLSGRHFENANLTGADLSSTRMVDTVLRGATLHGANLTGARLEKADLARANLAEANLTGARLLKTDLRGIDFAGSTWRRAALINVDLDPALEDAPELRGAVQAPGQLHPVVPGFAPPAVGVSFGFETGRIPSPVAYSPDGATLAIGTDDGGVLVCDASTGLPVRTLQGHRGRVYSVLYDQTTHQFITGAADLTVRLWDADTGEHRATVPGFSKWVWPMIASGYRRLSDWALIAAGDANGVMRIVDPQTGEVVRELAGHAAPIWAASFDLTHATLVVADNEGVLRAWELDSGTLRYEELCRDLVYRMTFHGSEGFFATGGHGGALELRDAATGRLLRELHGHDGHVYSLHFHPDGKLLASGDTQGSVRLWDTASGKSAHAMRRHTGAVYSVRFSPDGSTLATSDSDGVVRLWDTDQRQLRHELVAHRASVWPVVFRPIGNQLATSSNDGTTRLWNTQTGQCEATLRGHGRRVTSLSFRDNGSMFAACGNDGVVRLWDPATARVVRTLTSTTEQFGSVTFCPGSPLLAAVAGDGGVHLWNADTSTDERQLNVETDHVWAQSFSPDGDIIATANDDDTVRLWFRTTGRNIATLAGHRGRVRSVAFSPDGSSVLTGSEDATIRLWETATGGCRMSIEHHKDRVQSVAFSPDGTRFASASNDGTAVVWSPAGEQLHTLLGHEGRLSAVAFSLDGAIVATGGDDLLVRLWNTATGEEVTALTAHTRRVWALAFSPDGATLASAGDDGTVRLWDIAQPGHARLHLTLVGTREGWAALSPDGRYKVSGDVSNQFWHVIGTSRFEQGELDPYLPFVRQLPEEASFDRTQ